jgi:hypothetical protein
VFRNILQESVRSMSGVTGLQRKEEIASPHRRRAKVISWEQSVLTAGVSRLADRGNEAQLNFDISFLRGVTATYGQEFLICY